MTLRAHLQSWLHPRDPLLEAWKDDPFVAFIREHSGRDEPLTLKSLVGTMRILGIVFLPVLLVWAGAYMILHLMDLDTRFAFLAIFLILPALLLWEAVDKLLPRAPQPTTCFISIDCAIEEESSNGALVDPWLSGVRGRDIAKALYASKGQGGSAHNLPVWSSVLAWFTYSELLGPIDAFGTAGLACYALLLTWGVALRRLTTYPSGNPFRNMYAGTGTEIPSFLRALRDTRRDFPILSLLCFGGSGVIIFAAPAILSIVAAIHPDAFTTTGFFYLTIAILLVANGLAYLAPLGDVGPLLEELEGKFDLVDRSFDRFVRTKLIQDFDAWGDTQATPAAMPEKPLPLPRVTP